MLLKNSVRMEETILLPMKGNCNMAVFYCYYVIYLFIYFIVNV